MTVANLFAHPPSRSELLKDLMISDEAKIDLDRRMREPSRYYHTLDHLDLLWDRHRCYGAVELLHHSPISRLIAYALDYHDSIYIGGRQDNEVRSAELWLEVSATATDLDDHDRRWVADTIRATADHLGVSPRLGDEHAYSHARQWVIDLDLTPLGEPPKIFDRNMALLGAELPHLSEQQIQTSLMNAIRHFASAKHLYRCHSLAKEFEAAARSNFSRYLPLVSGEA